MTIGARVGWHPQYNPPLEVFLQVIRKVQDRVDSSTKADAAVGGA